MPIRRPARITPRPTRLAGDAYRRAAVEEITKALNLPRGATTQTAQQVTAGYMAALQRNNAVSGFNPLARDPDDALPFGPGSPLFPAPIAPLLPSGRQPPQRHDFMPAWNLQTTTTRLVPWTLLRDASMQIPLVRSCMDVCISAVTGLDWSFGIDTAKARALAKRSNTSSHEVISDLQDKFADDIDRLHQWWMKPDRVNNLTFVQWLTMLLEDELALDAVSIWPHFQMNGDLYAAEIIDSSTVKPLLDDRGAVPQPPFPAYQQIRYGFPRTEFTQPAPPELIDYEFTSVVYGRPQGSWAITDQLMYKVRNCRSSSLYGFSCVEQALPSIDLWLKRWDWLRSEYSAGVTPEMLVNVDMTMAPEQLRQYEAVFNDDLSGRTAERHRARFLPAGFTPMFPAGLDSKFNSDFDLHLVRLICASFDVLPTSLGFTPNHNGGLAGQSAQESEQDTQLMRGTKPRVKWLVGIINEICINYLGMPPEVTFNFHGIDDEDEQKEATLLEGYVTTGGMVLNEMRDRLNLPRYGIEQANEPFIATPTGPAFFNPDVQPVGMPGNLPSADQNRPSKQVEPSMDVGAAKEPRDQQVQGTSKQAEQKAFMSCVRAQAKSDREWRNFTFKAHSPVMAEAANLLASDGNVEACKALFEYADAA
jgi:hypothetical protein